MDPPCKCRQRAIDEGFRPLDHRAHVVAREPGLAVVGLAAGLKRAVERSAEVGIDQPRTYDMQSEFTDDGAMFAVDRSAEARQPRPRGIEHRVVRSVDRAVVMAVVEGISGSFRTLDSHLHEIRLQPGLRSPRRRV